MFCFFFFFFFSLSFAPLPPSPFSLSHESQVGCLSIHLKSRDTLTRAGEDIYGMLTSGATWISTV